MGLVIPFRYGSGYIDNAKEAMTNRKIQTVCCGVWDSFGPVEVFEFEHACGAISSGAW